MADLLENIDYNEDDVQNILNTFQSIRFTGSEEAHDVAYFTIANKDLYISKRNLHKLSKTMQKRIKQRAQFVEETSIYVLSSF